MREMKASELAEILRWILVDALSGTMNHPSEESSHDWLIGIGHMLYAHWDEMTPRFSLACSEARDRAQSGALPLGELATIAGAPLSEPAEPTPSTCHITESLPEDGRFTQGETLTDLMRWATIYLSFTTLMIHSTAAHPADPQYASLALYPFGETAAEMKTSLTDYPTPLCGYLLKDACIGAIGILTGGTDEHWRIHLASLGQCGGPDESQSRPERVVH